MCVRVCERVCVLRLGRGNSTFTRRRRADLCTEIAPFKRVPLCERKRTWFAVDRRRPSATTNTVSKTPESSPSFAAFLPSRSRGPGGTIDGVYHRPGSTLHYSPSSPSKQRVFRQLHVNHLHARAESDVATCCRAPSAPARRASWR